MVKKVKYKEPKGYFTPGMLKVAEEWEKENAKKSGASATSASAKSGIESASE